MRPKHFDKKEPRANFQIIHSFYEVFSQLNTTKSTRLSLFYHVLRRNETNLVYSRNYWRRITQIIQVQSS